MPMGRPTRFKYLAIDQNGEMYWLDSDTPRKELLDRFGTKHADKMYVDGPGGTALHIGYIIAGHWLTLYKVSPAFVDL